jgi:hypothetical protein
MRLDLNRLPGRPGVDLNIINNKKAVQDRALVVGEGSTQGGQLFEQSGSGFFLGSFHFYLLMNQVFIRLFLIYNARCLLSVALAT